jgi:hypothetical protein
MNRGGTIGSCSRQLSLASAPELQRDSVPYRRLPFVVVPGLLITRRYGHSASPYRRNEPKFQGLKPGEDSIPFAYANIFTYLP